MNESNRRKAFPENVEGDFYVEDGCCTTCGLPNDLAPDLFAESKNHFHCFVKKQPTTSQEMWQMMDVFEAQDVNCVRYKGTNRRIQIRLIGMGGGAQCDYMDESLKPLHNEVLGDPWGFNK